MALASIRPFLVLGIERQISSATSAYAATSRPAFSILALFGPDGLAKRGLLVGVKRTSIQGAPTSGNGRVEMWRGGVRENISVAAYSIVPSRSPFVAEHAPDGA